MVYAEGYDAIVGFALDDYDPTDSDDTSFNNSLDEQDDFDMMDDDI